MTTIYEAMVLAEGMMFRWKLTGNFYGYPQGRRGERIVIDGVEFPPCILNFSRYDKWTRPEKENEVCVRLDFGYPHDIHARAEWTLYLGQDGRWDSHMYRGHTVSEWLEEEDRIDGIIAKAIEEKNKEIFKEA